MVRLSNELFIFPTKFFSPVISDYRFLISDLNSSVFFYWQSALLFL